MQRTISPPLRKQTVREVGHSASLTLWASSLHKAAKKGGPYWIPVVLDALGHVATEVFVRNK